MKTYKSYRLKSVVDNVKCKSIFLIEMFSVNNLLTDIILMKIS